MMVSIGVLTACSGSPGSGVADVSRPSAGEVACASRVDAALFASSEKLWAHHKFLDANFRIRPTASPAHQQYVIWLEARMREIPGVEISERTQERRIDRWLEREAALRAGPSQQALQTVRIGGAVPYTTPTPPGGVNGPLVYIPLGEEITAAQAQGRIVVREVGYASTPRAAFLALQWWLYDPGGELTQMTFVNDYERDWVDNVQQRIDSMVQAAEAGAAGIVLIHDFPFELIEGHYAPYTGLVWPIPALYVGVDEGEALKQFAAEGGHGHLTLLANQGPATTRHFVATLAGASEERIVITSHTDGVNALWDNGPLVMLEMARYFARFPQECQPKTLEFGFTTGHLHHTKEPGASAEDYASELDHLYDDGTVAMVLVLEHLGALNYETQLRSDGKPGREFVLTGNPEPIAWLINEPILADMALQITVEHDMQQSIALRAADLPGARVPPHHSLGGEGTAYNVHLIPTAAFIAAPWTLFNANFSPEELMDKDLLYRQTLMFTDYLHVVGGVSRDVLAGSMQVQRELRNSLCAAGLTTLPTGEIVECEGTPADPGAGDGG